MTVLFPQIKWEVTVLRHLTQRDECNRALRHLWEKILSAANLPMAGIMFTVFKLAVAWRMFSGNSSPLKATRTTSALSDPPKSVWSWSCTGAPLIILTRRLLTATLPSVCVWWGPAGTAGRVRGCSESPQCEGIAGKNTEYLVQHGLSISK